MLAHLADAIEHGPSQQKGETYQTDAIEALEHGAELAGQKVANLMHCARIYDKLVDEPLEEPVR